MNKIAVYIKLFLFLISLSDIFSEETEIKLNVNNNFNNTIYRKDNLELNYIDKQPVYYSIKRQKHNIDKDTDLYLSFDKENDFDDTNRYKFIYKKYHSSENKSIYNKGAYFIGKEEKIELVGTKDSFFQSGVILSSFTISFWIYPLTLSNNEVILKIGSQFYNKQTESVEDQSISANYIDGSINWFFHNVFSSKNIKKDSLFLKSFVKILPERWNHITLVYDMNTGIIKEYINNVETGILIATENGTLDSTIFNLKYNQTNRCVIEIAPNYYGALDEFIIIKNTILPDSKKYNTNQAELISHVEDFGIGGIQMTNITPEVIKENNSDIIFLCRYANIPFDEDFTYSSEINWHNIDSKELYNQKVRFFQWKIIFLSGNNDDYSPKLRGIILRYKKNDPPAKPKGLQVIIENKKVKLKWLLNSEINLKGYKIYYGTKTKNYFGKDANEGNSPIDIGLVNNCELTGLKYDIIYYISITAYDDNNHVHESEFSDEVLIRPKYNWD